MTKVLVERELLERALRSIQHNVGFTDTINDLTATLAQPAHDVEASVPTFPCEFCGVFHSYSEVAEANGYCPQCEADYDERKMFADLLKRYTALAAAPKPVAQEARGIELKSDWDLLSSPSRRIAEEQQAVIDQLREQVAELERAITSSLPCSYYMDLPDGGDPSLEEQLRRMAEDAANLRIAELRLHEVATHCTTVEQELAALKSAPVVMPDRRIQALAGVSLFDLGHAKGWNACLDKFESLNRSKT